MRHRVIALICISVVSVSAAVAWGSVTQTYKPSRIDATSCHRIYLDTGGPANANGKPHYKREVFVSRHPDLTCGQAAGIGNDMATRYERGLPVRDYPTAPGPTHVPGAQGKWFRLQTALGGFSCLMTARLSDFVSGRCKQRRRLVVFGSENHLYLNR
jgi:hypothetical protein